MEEKLGAGGRAAEKGKGWSGGKKGGGVEKKKMNCSTIVGEVWLD